MGQNSTNIVVRKNVRKMLGKSCLIFKNVGYFLCADEALQTDPLLGTHITFQAWPFLIYYVRSSLTIKKIISMGNLLVYAHDIADGVMD